MKVKVKYLNPNPFKKQISKGKLNKETINKIQANIKELGLMGSLPVFKKDKKYFLVAGHHRLEALKRTFGNQHEVEVVVHNYTDENVLRGMVVENLTQRSDELLEVTENLNAVRNFLRKNSVQRLNTLGKGGRGVEEAGSVRNIHDWLNQTGDVMSIGKISEYLKVHDNLDKSLLKQAVDKLSNKDYGISIEDAKTLSRLDKKEQKPMRTILDKTGLGYKEKAKLVTEYLSADAKVKEKVLKGKVDVTDIALANHSEKLGNIDLSRKKLDIEKHIELRNSLKEVFGQKLFFKKSATAELERTYHFIINWLKGDLLSFLKEIETELKSRGKTPVTYEIIGKGVNDK